MDWKVKAGVFVGLRASCRQALLSMISYACVFCLNYTVFLSKDDSCPTEI